jgi:hypothetical protein
MLQVYHRFNRPDPQAEDGLNDGAAMLYFPSRQVKPLGLKML